MRFKSVVSPAVLGLALFYGVELLDEFISGMHGAVLPSLKNDLALSYTEVGLLSTVPGLVAVAAEPWMGVAGDTRHRRTLVVAGITATAASLVLTGLAPGFPAVLVAFIIAYSATGAYVSLSQATLMDRSGGEMERAMVKWTLAGHAGALMAPALAAGFFSLGLTWRGLYLAMAGLAALFIVPLARGRFEAQGGVEEEGEVTSWRERLRAMMNRELWRWIILTSLADLLLDKLIDVTGLYFHDVVGVSLAEASLGVGALTGAGLVGNALLLPILKRVKGMRVVKVTAGMALALYCIWLLEPFVPLKFVLVGGIGLLTAGWYPILHGRTYAALPGQSGLVVAASSLAHIITLFVPVTVGLIADNFGLPAAMWLLALGPVALLLGVPKEEG